MDNAPDKMQNITEDKGKGYAFNPYRGFYSIDPKEEAEKSVAAASGKLGNALLTYYGLSLVIAYASKATLSLLASLQRMFFSGVSLPFDMISDSLGMLSQVLCLFLPFFFFLGPKDKGRQITLGTPKFVPTVTAVIMTLGVAVVGSAAADAMSAFFSLFRVQLIYPSYTVGVTPAALAMTLVQVVIVPAVLEEVVFRGIVMQSLRHLGDTFALVASSFAFAILHGNPLQIPYAFLMGIAIGYFVLITGSLWTGIIAHLVNNLVTVLLSVLSVVAGKNYSVEVNVIFFVIIAAALCCFIISAKKGRLIFHLSHRDAMITLSDQLTILFSRWQVAFASAVALFLMIAKYVKVG